VKDLFLIYRQPPSYYIPKWQRERGRERETERERQREERRDRERT
jgi:hypothetical protein